MINKIARLISTIFIPPVNLIILFTYMALSFETDALKTNIVILSAVILGFFAPIVFFIILRRRNKLVDNDASNKDERTVPYIFNILVSLVAFLILYILEVSHISIVTWGLYIVNTLVLIIINNHWKISAHAQGVTIPGTIILYLDPSYGLIVLAVLLMVCWSRIQLKVHTIAQVVAGSLLGVFITLVSLLLLSTQIEII